MSDQQRADMSAAEGFALDTTPAFDQLGRAGFRSCRAYSPTPVCLPARCSYLTGRFPSGHGQPTNALGCAAYERDLVDVLHEAGHVTALYGKDHTYRQGAALGVHPAPAAPYDEHIFERVLQAEPHADPKLRAQHEAFRAWYQDLAHGISDVATPFPVGLQQPARVVDRAVRFLANAPDEPFYLFLGFDPPHNPYQVPEPYFSLFDVGDVPPALPRDTQHRPFAWQHLRRMIEHFVDDPDGQIPRYRANYCGMLRLLDDQLARLLEALDASGRADETLVLVTSDHGDYAGDHGLLRKGAGLPESLIRIPFAVRGPGVGASTQPSEAHVSLVDVLPTLCGLLGVEPPAGVHGRDLTRLWAGEAPAAEFDSIYAEVGTHEPPLTEADRPPLTGPGEHGLRYTLTTQTGKESFSELNPVTMAGHWRAVVRGDAKLVRDPYGGESLYDVAADPAEGTDLSAERPGQRRAMAALLDRWETTAGA